MKRLILVALVVATATACTGGKTGPGRGATIARQYDQQSTHDSERGEMDRAIGQR